MITDNIAGWSSQGAQSPARQDRPHRPPSPSYRRNHRHPIRQREIAARAASAVAAGPLIGGAVTTFASWHWVFVGEAVIVIGIFAALRKVHDTPPAVRVHFDFTGAVLSVAGLCLLVFGVLRSGTWGFVKAKPGGPQLLGTSPVVWLVLSGLLVIYGFFLWEARVQRRTGLIPVKPIGRRQHDVATCSRPDS
jgi:hypothetical protein